MITTDMYSNNFYMYLQFVKIHIFIDRIFSSIFYSLETFQFELVKQKLFKKTKFDWKSILLPVS